MTGSNINANDDDARMPTSIIGPFSTCQITQITTDTQNDIISIPSHLFHFIPTQTNIVPIQAHSARTFVTQFWFNSGPKEQIIRIFIIIDVDMLINSAMTLTIYYNLQFHHDPYIDNL